MLKKLVTTALLVSAVIIPTAAAAPMKPSGVVDISVANGSLHYDQKTFTTSAGLVKINFTNNSTTAHNVSLEHDGEFEYGATLTIHKSATTTFLTLAKGTYHLYSSVGKDEDKGMSATLIVK